MLIVGSDGEGELEESGMEARLWVSKNVRLYYSLQH